MAALSSLPGDDIYPPPGAAGPRGRTGTQSRTGAAAEGRRETDTGEGLDPDTGTGEDRPPMVAVWVSICEMHSDGVW